jgi:hypothetical protein
MTIALPPANTQGYLVVPGGVLYSRQTMTLSAKPTSLPSSRADFEADLKAAASANALSDAKLAAALDKVDHTKTMWFAGTGAGTPIANHLGEFYGSFDLTGGLAIEATAQLLEPSLADKIESGVKDAKAATDQMPEAMRPAVTSLKLTRQGDHLHATDRLDSKQLAELMKQMAAFAPPAPR